MPYERVKTLIKHYLVQELSDSVQKFYFHRSNSCCAIIVNDIMHLDEVIELLKEIA